MLISSTKIKSLFKVYNQKYFENKLPTPILSVRNTKRLGCCKFKFDGFFSPIYYQIVISTRYDYTEDQLKEVLLHEMCHLYIMHNGIADNAQHGIEFHRIADKVSKASGVVITDYGNANDYSFAEKRMSHVIAYLWGDGSAFMFVTSENRVNTWINSISRKIGCADIVYFRTYDEQFANMPSCRTRRRGRRLNSEEFYKLKKQYNTSDRSQVA